MTVLQALFQGIIQGLAEFLPVSSSGHLSVIQHFFGISGDEGIIATMIMHLGTLVAVFVAFWGKIKALIIEFFRMIGEIFTGKFSFKKMSAEQNMIVMIILSILPLFAFYIFKDFFEGLSTDNDIVVEGIGFLYTSALLFLATSKSCSGGTLDCGTIKPRQALFIGFFQGVALIPGISRSGSTICSAMISGVKKEDAVEYSFILGIPVILAGTLVELKDAGSAFGTGEIDILPLAVCFLTAAIIGYFSICLIKLLIVSDKFRIFAYYTLAIGIIVTAIGIYEKVTGMPITISLAR